MLRVAIDPGYSGAIAWRKDDDPVGEVSSVKMPSTTVDLLTKLTEIRKLDKDAVCYLENVGTYRPGNSGPAAVKFARHCGHLDVAVLASGFDEAHTVRIVPVKWMNAFLGKKEKISRPDETPDVRKKRLAQEKQIRKDTIKVKAKKLYPSHEITLNNADALGLLYTASTLL